MSDPYIDRKFDDIVAPQVHKGVSNNLSRYLEAAGDHEVSDRAATYVMSKLWADDERYRARIQALYGDPPSEPPTAPPSAQDGPAVL